MKKIKLYKLYFLFALLLAIVQAEAENYTTKVYSNDCSTPQTAILTSGMTLTLEAVPEVGNHFTQWSDGSTSNPRTITITQNSNYTAQFARNSYTISTASNNDVYGTTQGGATALYYGDTITISATPNYGYHFTRWSDGNTQNPRLVLVTCDSSFTAEFAKNQYVVSASGANGTVSGVGTYNYLTSVSLTATPNYGYHFTGWNDGNTDNPRTIILTQDTAFTAQIVKTYTGQCGESLYWKYADGVLNITGTGAMYDYTADSVPWLLFRDSIKSLVICVDATTIGSYAFYGCSEMSAITIPNQVTSIGVYAFSNCTGLRSAIMGTDISNIGANAFSGDTRIYDITCYAASVPVAEESSFANYNAYLHIPCNSQRYYTIDPVFGRFGNIECIGSEESTTSDFTIQGGQNDATFEWPTNSTAETYTMTITKDSVVFCTLTFNANGQLMNIAFAPGRGASNAQQAEQTATGYKFTVTGLNTASQYGYTFKALDSSSQSVATYTGTFNTEGYTALDNVNANSNIQKYIHNGRLYILRNGQTYDASGREVK